MRDPHARYRRAGADPRRRPSPGFPVTQPGRFNRLVGDVVKALPPTLLGYLDEVEIAVEDVPRPDSVGRGDEVPLARYKQASAATGLPAGRPDRIVLFRRPIEARATSRADLATLVRDVVVHEIADHFGLDDDQLDEFGW